MDMRLLEIGIKKLKYGVEDTVRRKKMQRVANLYTHSVFFRSLFDAAILLVRWNFYGFHFSVVTLGTKILAHNWKAASVLIAYRKASSSSLFWCVLGGSYLEQRVILYLI